MLRLMTVKRFQSMVNLKRVRKGPCALEDNGFCSAHQSWTCKVPNSLIRKHSDLATWFGVKEIKL